MSEFANRLLLRIKKTLRQADNEFDDEIGSYIDTCALDLQNAGILSSFFVPEGENWEPDNQILQACRWYTLSVFGLYNADMDKYEKAYSSLKATLATQRFYTEAQVEMPEEPETPDTPVIPEEPEDVPISPFGKKLYTFGGLSDIHLRPDNFKNGIDDFNRAIDVLQTLGVDFVCIAGDVGYYSNVNELELYKSAIDTRATVPFYACTGNHDYGHSNETWKTYVGHSLNYEFVKDGDVFLFMSVNQPSTAAELAEPYGEYLDWLKERLIRYKGARIFIFMHYPLTGYAGLRDNTYYGFSSSSTEDDELLAALIDTKNTVVFSGHTHYKFDCEATYDTINIFNFQHKKVSLVHIPSCAYPRNASHVEEPDLSEGYIVDVYEKGTILRGVDFVSGEYMPDYEYVLTIDNNPIVAKTAAITVSTNDIALKSGESYEVEVSLTNPINIALTVAEDNNYISVSPESLTFTEENYSIPQKVVINAGEFNTSEMSVVTISGDGLTPKTISISLTYEAAEPEGIEIPQNKSVPEDGAVYSGECGSSGGTANDIYQLYDGDVAGEFSFKFDNLKVKSSQTVLYFGVKPTATSTGSLVNLTLKGSNTIDVSVASSTSQRGISSSGTMGNYLTGEGEGAELIIKGDPDAATEVIKGNWVIENAKVVAAGTAKSGYFLVETVTPATLTDEEPEPAGITLYKSGEFSFGKITSDLQILSENIATVKLLPCDHGYLKVNLGSAELGKAPIVVENYPDDGYSLTAIKVDSVAQYVDTVLTMPQANATLTIQGVFTK